MSTIRVKRAHNLAPGVARSRVEEIAKELRDQYGVDYAWKGNHLSLHRMGASGTVTLGNGFVEIEVKIGLTLRPMKAKIEASVQRLMERAAS